MDATPEIRKGCSVGFGPRSSSASVSLARGHGASLGWRSHFQLPEDPPQAGRKDGSRQSTQQLDSFETKRGWHVFALMLSGRVCANDPHMDANARPM